LQGVIIGQLTSTCFMGWIGISGLIYGRPSNKYAFLPSTTDNCNETSYPMLMESTTFNSTWSSSLATTTYAHTPYVVEAGSSRKNNKFSLSHVGEKTFTANFTLWGKTTFSAGLCTIVFVIYEDYVIIKKYANYFTA